MRNFLWEGGGGEKRSYSIVAYSQTGDSARRPGCRGIGGKQFSITWNTALEFGDCFANQILFGIESSEASNLLYLNGMCALILALHFPSFEVNISGISIFFSFIRFRLGRGKLIRFWENMWIGAHPLKSLILDYINYPLNMVLLVLIFREIIKWRGLFFFRHHPLERDLQLLSNFCPF